MILIPDFRINLSLTVKMYVQEFKNFHNIGFGRRDENGGEPKYRSNIPLTLFSKIKEGMEAIDTSMKQQEFSPPPPSDQFSFVPEISFFF